MLGKFCTKFSTMEREFSTIEVGFQQSFEHL